MFSQNEIDQMSGTLKRHALVSACRRGIPIPEINVDVWFVNASDGPQFWCGRPNGIDLQKLYPQPLYRDPPHETSKPVAWISDDVAPPLVTQDKSLYREDIKWSPLFVARQKNPNFED